MIDCHHFEFAAPPYTGTDWFLRACAIAGLIERVETDAIAATNRFPVAVGKKLRVSLVCNPLDWLVEAYNDPAGRRLPTWAFRVAMLPRDQGIAGFVRQYLEHHAGTITKLFLAYRADTVVRLEDCPEAFFDLIAPMMDIPESLIFHSFLRRPPRMPGKLSVPSWLRGQVIEAERAVFDAYDYW